MYQNINFINFILEFLKITKKDPISKKFRYRVFKSIYTDAPKIKVTNVVNNPVITFRKIVLLVETSELCVQTIALIDNEAIIAINVNTTRCSGLARIIVNNGIIAPIINEQKELAAA